MSVLLFSQKVRNYPNLRQEIEMTRKDFILIAEVIRNLDEVLDEYALEVLAENMAEALADTNTQFDQARFLTACGVK